MLSLRAGAAVLGLALMSGAASAQAPARDPDEGWPVGERVMTKYKAGRYAEVIAEGPAAVQAEPWNADLRLALANSYLWSNQEWPAIELYQGLLDGPYATEARIGIANSLAWSGRMHEAIPHYELALAGAKGGEAKLGLANAWLWLSRPDISLPLYDQLRAAHPMEDVGIEGQIRARRLLRAKTTVGFGYLHDNTPTTRREPFVSHTFRALDNTLVFGIDASGGEDYNDDRRLDRREYGFRFEAVAAPLAPRINVWRQTEPAERTFGELRLQVAPWPLHVYGGRVNWGKLSFTVPAAEQGLTANRFGVEGRYQFSAGELRGYANTNDVSDGNRIENADVRLTSRWRPWGRQIKPFVGVALRYSDREDPDYWSPRRYGIGYVGLEGEWDTLPWTVNAIAQVGVGIIGDASTAWAGSLIVKRWLAEDWAVGLNAYAQGGTRTSNYRAAGLTVLLEKLW
jgi:tetratricopeptide (TPR) repeat protein